MAEQDSSQERSEEATLKRKEESREKGDIVRSKELNTTVVLLAGSSGLLIFGDSIASGMASMMRHNFVLSREDVFDVNVMTAHLGSSISHGFLSLTPVFIMLVIAAIVGPIALGGWAMSGKSLMPKGDRISPLAGLKRMFAMRAFVELVKSIAKFLLVASLAVLILHVSTVDILAIGKREALGAMSTAVSVVGWAGLWLSATMILISLVDVPFQLWDHSRKLKMTKQEVKDEMKNTEGKPEVKSRIRQLQNELSQRRMMSAVPEADVVITNPEHYAVALKYNSDKMGAPVLVAKGADFVAQKIREVARANNVTLLEAPPLARSVFYSTEIDHEIPAGLYVAVAQVLAYVFQLRRYKQGKARNPGVFPDVPIPENLRRDD